jgi:hypothetical protein
MIISAFGMSERARNDRYFYPPELATTRDALRSTGRVQGPSRIEELKGSLS